MGWDQKMRTNIKSDRISFKTFCMPVYFFFVWKMWWAAFNSWGRGWLVGVNWWRCALTVFTEKNPAWHPGLCLHELKSGGNKWMPPTMTLDVWRLSARRSRANRRTGISTATFKQSGRKLAIRICRDIHGESKWAVTKMNVIYWRQSV